MKRLADGKREHDFDVAISLAVFVKKSLFTKQGLDPNTCNPYKQMIWINDTRTDEQKKADTKEGMAALKQGLAMMVAQRG